MTDDDLRKLFAKAKNAVPRPYDTDVLEADQDINVWLDHHGESVRQGLRAVAAAAWDEGVRAIERHQIEMFDGVSDDSSPTNPYALVVDEGKENRDR